MLSQMFNCNVPDEVEIRVYDSTSDIRYMVLPSRPKGTENMKQENLAKLVAENSLIGVGNILEPSILMVDSESRQ